VAEKVIIVKYNPDWEANFDKKAKMIRSSMGNLALRIDHIGSTSINDLDAKPIIDIQVSVSSFKQKEAIVEAMRNIGYRHKPDSEEKSKLYFREMPGEERTHIHVRLLGHFSQQFPLLFRDYMRLHPEECKLYSDLKYKLASRYADQRPLYVAGKEKLIWEIMRRADRWAQQTGWSNGKSDH